MSDDEADPELLELLRQTLGLGRPKPTDEVSSVTGVLRDAEHVYNNAIDVSIDMYGTKAAAASIYSAIQQRGYSTLNWSEHELHPSPSEGFSDIDIVNFVFTMDLLNFSFWSELSDHERYQVEYRDRRWTGYNSLVACLRRAVDGDVPITTPRFWNDPKCSDETLKMVFWSATNEEMPLLRERIAMLREAGNILHESFGDPDLEPEEEVNDVTDRPSNDLANPLIDKTAEFVDSKTRTESSEPESAETIVAEPSSDTKETETGPVQTSQDPTGDRSSADASLPHKIDETKEEETPAVIFDNEKHSEMKTPPKPDLSVVRLITKAEASAGKLINLLAKHFPSFRDETRFDGQRVRFLKRAQIFVADLWAAFHGTSYGAFDDVDHLTMFADYRVPQMLRSLGVQVYSPPLEYAISSLKEIPSGHSWEVQLRGCSIWAVELIRREILRQHPEATGVNAVLIDFLLYDLAKEREALGAGAAAHHRTRSIWY